MRDNRQSPCVPEYNLFPLFASGFPGLKVLLLILFFVSGILPVNAQGSTYEAEAGSLLNGASLQSCASCSGTKQVGNLGGSQNGSIVSSVNVSAGDYRLTLAYA